MVWQAASATAASARVRIRRRTTIASISVLECHVRAEMCDAALDQRTTTRKYVGIPLTTMSPLVAS